MTAEVGSAASPCDFVAHTSAKLADRYADLLAHGWRRRTGQLVNPALDFADLCAYDHRIQTALSALASLEGYAQQHMCNLLKEPLHSAELFALMYYALAMQDRALLDAAAALTVAIPDLLSARVAALEWAPASPLLESAIESLPAEKRIRMVGLRYRDFLGMDGRTLAWLRTQAPDAENISAALQLIRDLGRADMALASVRYLDHDQGTVQLAAAQTLLVLGPPSHHEEACETLRKLAACGQEIVSVAALRTLALHAPIAAESVLTSLRTRPEKRRLYLSALGWSGHTDGIPMLIEALDDGSYSSVAAGALCLITGSDPVRDGWLGATPKRSPPPDQGDQIPTAPDDDKLPWPDTVAFAAWWRTHGSHFPPGQRYFAGRPLTPDWLSTVLKTGPLPWRTLAAEHRQRLDRGPLFPTHLPANAQRTRFHELN